MADERQYADPDTGEIMPVKHFPPPRPPVPVQPDVPSLPMNSASIAELTKALVVAQAIFEPIERTASAKITESRSYQYAPLEDIIASTKEGLTKAGLVISQTTHPAPRGAVLVTMLQHISGEWKASYWPLSATGRPQDQGSELTYARRYQRCAILDIQPEDADDDGAAASKPAPQTRPAPRPAKPVSKAASDFVDGLEPQAGAYAPQPAPYAKGSEPPPDDDMGIGEYVGTPDKVTQNPKGNYFKVHFGNEWFGTFSKTNSSVAKDAPGAVRITYKTKLVGESKTPVKEIVDIRAE